MAKRKRGIAQSTSKAKKRKTTSAAQNPDHPHGEVDSQQEYKVRRILREKKGEYYIDWEDDEITGEAYKPTWEPKSNANQLAIDEWEARKRAQTTPRKRGRSSRVVHSSPTTEQRSASTTNGHTRLAPNTSQPVRPELEIEETPLYREVTPEDSSRPLPNTALGVQVSDPPSSFRRGEYERFGTPVAAPADQGSKRHQRAVDSSPLRIGEAAHENEVSEPQELSAKAPSPQVGSGAPEGVAEDHRDQTTEASRIPQADQAESEDSESLFIPDSQSQRREETFQGFSPYGQSQAASSQALPLTQPPASPSANTNSPRPAINEGSAESQPQGTAGRDSSRADQPDRTQLTDNEFRAISEAFERATSQQQRRPSISEAGRSEGSNQGDDSLSAVPAAQAAVEQVLAAFQRSLSDEALATAGKQAEDTEVPVASEQASRQDLNHNGSRQEAEAAGSSAISNEAAIVHSHASDALAQSQAHIEQHPSAVRPISISSDSQTTSSQFISQPDFNPPPAGQRPPPSSLSKDITQTTSPKHQVIASSGIDARLSEEDQAPEESEPAVLTQSSTAFLTQLPPVASPVADPKLLASSQPHTGALFIQDLPKPTPQPSSNLARQTPESSPFPSIPSRTLDTIGESAPPRIGTLSSNSARSSPYKASPMTSKGSGELASKLRAAFASKRSASRASSLLNEQPASSLPPNMTAERAAARMASPLPVLQDGTRSPSTVPAAEPVPVISKEEMNTSERYETLLPQAQNTSSDLEDHRHSGGPISPNNSRQAKPPDMDTDSELADVYVVPISLPAHQRDQYLQNIYYHKEAIEQFLQTEEPNLEQVQEAERIIERLRDIATHPDLVNEDTLSQVSTPERQAQWDMASSGKFRFLRDLVEDLAVRCGRAHVAVLARSGRVSDMLETFLQGCNISYTRNPGSRRTSADFDEVEISLLTTDQDRDTVEAAHVVITIDGGVDPREQVIRLARPYASNEGKTGSGWPVLLQLVVPRTVEHIERCLVPNLTRKARARIILNATQQLRDQSARLEDGQAKPREAARLVARFIHKSELIEWPLEGLSQIEDLDTSTQTDLNTTLNGSTDDHDDSNKRPYGVLGSASPSQSSKRPRLEAMLDTAAIEMPATINPMEIDITHVSDSVEKTTQTHLEGSGIGQSGETSALEKQLSEVIERTRADLDAHVRDLEELQYRYEAQRTELAETKSALTDATATTMTAVERMNQATTSNGALRAERTDLKQRLEDANKKLLEHEVPERREFEELRLAFEKAQIDKDKAGKRAESALKDLEWTRTQYQDASSKARQLAEQNTELEERVVKLERLASDRQLLAQQESNKNRHSALARQNRLLKQQLKDREMTLKLKDEELQRLKEASRGRMGTRATSVPRSPRHGSPLKGRGSRQTSPAAGDLKGRATGLHPLRNSG